MGSAPRQLKPWKSRARVRVAKAMVEASAARVAQVEGCQGDDGNEQTLKANASQQSLGEDGRLGIPGLSVEEAAAGGLHADGDGREGVGEQVDEQ